MNTSNSQYPAGCYQAPVFNPQTDKFWMVVGIQACGNGPKVMHKTEELALAEASRLAKIYTGTSFAVLESIKKCVAQQPVVVSNYR